MFRKGQINNDQMAELSNPRVPLTWQLGTLTSGLSIHVDAFAPHNSERFSINLQTGSANNISSDILFHFNPRFGQKEIVRNARFSGSWGSEEKQGGMPITKNRRFTMQIVIEPQHFMVQIDGRLFCHFRHRADFNLANTMTCDGNLTLNKVSYRRAFNPQPPMPPVVGPTAPVFPSIPIDGAGGYPGSYPGGYPGGCVPGGYPTGCVPPPYPGPPGSIPPVHPGGGFPPMPNPTMPIVNPKLPLTTAIPGGMTLGRTILVSCKIKPRAKRFKINLQFGASGSDIALHFNPRYDGEETVVMNAKVGNAWGKEEKHPLPAGLKQRGANAEIRIILNMEDFHVYVNGQFYASFRHRVSCQQPLDTLHIDEDCEVYNVSFL